MPIIILCIHQLQNELIMYLFLNKYFKYGILETMFFFQLFKKYVFIMS